MASAARKNEYIYAPSKVYSYSRAATAEALPQQEPQIETETVETPAPAYHPVHNTRIRREPSHRVQRKRRTLPKLASFAGVIATAAVLVFMVLRYATITSEWSQVNDIQRSITESRRRIAELEVQLDEAISLEDARLSAVEAGLDYPNAEQIVSVNGTVGQYQNSSSGGN